MKSRILAWSACLCLCLAGFTIFADAPSLIAIRNAKVVTVSGPVLDKGTVIIRNGLIDAVGTDVAIPAGAWVIDGTGMTVFPGLIDGLNTWGIPEAAPAAAAASATGARRAQTTPAPTPTPAPAIPAAPAGPPARGPEDRPSTTSWVRAADLVSPTDRRIDAARSAGYTTVMTFQKQGLVAGQGAAVNLGGQRAGDMVVHSAIGMYLTMTTAGFGAGFPSSLFGAMAYIRQLWIDAAYYKLEQERYAKGASGKVRPRYDRALEGVLAAPRVLLPAGTTVQIDRMLRFGKELNTPFILYGVHEAYLAADLIKKAGVPVVVNLHWPVKDRDADPEAEETLRDLELRDKAPSTPAALAKAGVPFTFSADGVETPREALRAVKRAIEAGLSREAALRALTLSAAEIYGLSDRLGSVDKGKIANLVVVKGDIFDDRLQVQMIFVDGIKYDPAPETPTPPGGFGAGRPGGPPPVDSVEDDPR